MPEAFQLEHAKSGRSICKGCNTLIEQGEVRFGVGTISEKTSTKSLKYYHPTFECAAEQFKSLGNMKTEKIDGFKSLDKSEQSEVAAARDSCSE